MRRPPPAVLPRRALLAAALAAPGLATLLAPGRARAQAFPSRPVRLISPFAAGSSVDLMARAIAGPLAEILGQPVVVENRGGAGGNLGVDAVAKAAKDGHTLGIGTSGPLAINPALLPAMPYDVARDLAPVSLLAVGPNLVVASPALPASSVAELVALAKARPGALNYGSSGVGSSNHLAGALFAAVAGVEITHVPYRGNAEMMNDLIGGQLHLVFSGIPPVLPLWQDGRVKVLAVSGPARIPAMPGVPTVAEAGLAGAEAEVFYGVVAPAGTPAPILATLNQAITRTLAREDVRATFARLGSEARASTQAEFRRLIAGDTAKWRRVIERFGIRPG